MRNIKLTTITLKKRDFKEKDRIITVLSREFGKFDLIGKGVQKTINKLSGISEPLSYGTIIVSNLKNLGSISSCDQRECFNYIHKNLNILSHAIYLLELCDKCTAYENQVEDIFDYLLSCLLMLENQSNPETIIRFFEHKLINCLGYNINTKSCIGCGKRLGDKIFYNPDFGGFFCESCNIINRNNYIFPKAILSYIEVFDKFPISKIQELNFQEQVNKDLSFIYKKQLAYRIDKDINSINFIRAQKNIGAKDDK